MRFRLKNLTHPAVVCLLAFGSMTSSAGAGQINDELAARMRSAGADELLPVIIRPVGTVVGSVLKRQVAANVATRAGRHRAAVETWQAAARRSQPPILAALADDYYQNRVYDAKGYWIDNIITAEMTPSAIAEIADRSDVDEIILMPKISLIAPLAVPDATATGRAAGAQSIENGLIAIKADSVWMLGYTGKGRLVASIDTGVSGKHIGLESRWRGNNGYSAAESWFDPIYPDSVPQTYSGGLSPSHGTRGMSIMVGTVDILGDTLGVCPDCQWISAAAIDIPCPVAGGCSCGNLFDAMQWVADPDGDPITETDVPDAVANPWGALNEFAGCSDVFWNAIDNVEAAGAAMIFAAGNEGSGVSTIRNPANRIQSETNAFAVGMVDTRLASPTPPVDVLSSRGPSDCDDVTIKPEIVAPGVNIRSFFGANSIDPPGGGSAYGTSFSSPHVAAAIALLREYNPNATVDEIKTALLNSATDLGPTGPDNAYGHGLLDIMGAIRLLPENTEPDLYVKRDYYTRPAPGGTTEMVLLLRSSGAIAATGISVNIISEHPRLSVLTAAASFPDITAASDTSGNFAEPFEFSVATDAISGERLALRIEISADGGYARTLRAALQVGPVQSDEVFTHDAGNFQLSISAMGMYGLSLEGLSPRPGGIGYFYGADPTQSLFEGSFLLGTDANHVSDNVRNAGMVPDVDFQVDPGGRLGIMEPSVHHDEETRAAFSDATAENPIGVFVEQRTWVDTDVEKDDYLVAEYTITNRSGETITGLRAGLFFDWDFPWTGPVATRDGGGFNQSEGIGWMRHRDENRFRGLAVISPMGTTSYYYYDNLTELFDADLLSEWDKWRALAGGFLQTEPPLGLQGDGSHLIGTGPFTILPDSTITVAFAIIGATTESGLITSVRQARAEYACASKNCLCHSDPQCDGISDVLDVVRAVDVAFRGSPDIPDPDPTCLQKTTDIDCDGVTTILDVVRFVDVAFRNEDPELRFCDPCAP
ncbi:MAG: S8 family serine peptidase [Acidobacteria bacterium]|nr:S8 family serine peptidase [Acidobacteriota bacterium]